MIWTPGEERHVPGPRPGVAAGKTLPTEQCFEVALEDVEDFVCRWVTGDHYIVAYGDHLKEACMLMDMVGIDVLVPGGKSPVF